MYIEETIRVTKKYGGSETLEIWVVRRRNERHEHIMCRMSKNRLARIIRNAKTNEQKVLRDVKEEMEGSLE